MCFSNSWDCGEVLNINGKYCGWHCSVTILWCSVVDSYWTNSGFQSRHCCWPCFEDLVAATLGVLWLPLMKKVRMALIGYVHVLDFSNHGSTTVIYGTTTFCCRFSLYMWQIGPMGQIPVLSTWHGFCMELAWKPHQSVISIFFSTFHMPNPRVEKSVPKSIRNNGTRIPWGNQNSDSQSAPINIWAAFLFLTMSDTASPRPATRS